MTLEDPDDDDELDKCQFVVGLLQKDRRQMKLLGQDNLTIGFAIYKVFMPCISQIDARHGRIPVLSFIAAYLIISVKHQPN